MEPDGFYEAVDAQVLFTFFDRWRDSHHWLRNIEHASNSDHQ